MLNHQKLIILKYHEYLPKANNLRSRHYELLSLWLYNKLNNKLNNKQNNAQFVYIWQANLKKQAGFKNNNISIFFFRKEFLKIPNYEINVGAFVFYVKKELCSLFIENYVKVSNIWKFTEENRKIQDKEGCFFVLTDELYNYKRIKEKLFEVINKIQNR